MRQIDNMTPTELDALRLKGMLGASKASMKTSTVSPFQPLHPTLRKCKCGNIMTKRELYKHFDDIRRRMKVFNEPAREFFIAHGEVPLRTDDPKLNLETALQESLVSVACQQTDTNTPLFNPNEIPSGHRLDDNNTADAFGVRETPTK